MKRFFIITVLLLCMVACQPEQKKDTQYTAGNYSESMEGNVGYTIPGGRVKGGDIKALDKYGNSRVVCHAYYGEFNGHTWYIFYDKLAVPSVVHDPLCHCGAGR